MKRSAFLFLVILLLVGCESRTDLAPVAELKWRAPTHHAAIHIVQRGETLYSLAFRYDLDYRQLASLNHLHSPYTLRVGQVIRLQSRVKAIEPYPTSRSRQQIIPIRRQSYQPTRYPVRRVVTPYQSWMWPVTGKVESHFIPFQGKKGIDIAGKKGDKVRAAANGVVAYAGHGLLGYGNLIIIKHSNQYLTAYGNNLRNLVREGQVVKVGQVIAEIGVIDRRYWGVHFEIRKAGKPVNPLTYLPRGD